MSFGSESVKVSVEVEGVPVSVCAVCGEREVARVQRAEPPYNTVLQDGDWTLKCMGWSFLSHKRLSLPGEEDLDVCAACYPALLDAFKGLVAATRARPL